MHIVQVSHMFLDGGGREEHILHHLTSELDKKELIMKVNNQLGNNTLRGFNIIYFFKNNS